MSIFDEYRSLAPRPVFGLPTPDMYSLRNVLRGTTQPIEGVLALARAPETATAIGDWMNRQLGTSNARFASDPEAAALQTLGGSLLPTPFAGAIGRAISGLPVAGQVAARAVEAALPTTAPYTLPNILLNTGVGAAVGAAYEAADDYVSRSEPHGKMPFPLVEPAAAAVDNAPFPLVEPAATAQTQTAQTQTQTAQTQTQPDLRAPTARGSEPFPLVEPEAPPDTSWQRQALTVAPYLLLGAAAGMAARQAYLRARSSAILSGTVVHPGGVPDPTIARPTVAQEAANAAVDEGSVLRGVIRQAEGSGFITPEQAQVLRGHSELETNFYARGTMARNLLQTGLLPDGVSIGRALRDMTEDVASVDRASPQRGAELRNFLAIGNELSNRRRAAEERQWTQKYVNPQTGQPNTVNVRFTDPQTGRVYTRAVPEPVRVGMWDRSYDDLTREYDRIRNTDPVFYDRWQREWLRRNRRILDFLVRPEWGAISATERAKMLRANQFYVPTLDAPDAPRSSNFTVRRIGEETQPRRAQDPFQAQMQYEIEAMHFATLNRAKREVGQFLHRYQQQLGPQHRIVGNTIQPYQLNIRDHPGSDVLTWRENGRPMRLEVFVPQIAKMMRNEPQYVFPVLNGTRRLLQNTLTGAPAAIVGKPFAPISGLYNLTTLLSTRPRGFSAGLLDAAAQRATGGRIGVRMDPTFIGQTLAAPIKDATAILTRELATQLRGTALNGWADKLAQWYMNSVHADMMRYGSGGISIARATDVMTNSPADLGQLSPRLDSTRGLVLSGPVNFNDYMRYGQTFVRTAVPHQLRSAWNLFNELLDTVTNAPQSAFVRQNRRSTSFAAQRFSQQNFTGLQFAEALHRVARQLGGDPSISGSSKGVQALNSSIPYLNVATQSLAQYGRAFHENPAGTITAVAISTIVPVLLSKYSALLYDEDRISRGEQPVAVQDSTLEAQGNQAGSLPFYMPGVPMERTLRFPMDPVLGPSAQMASRVIENMLGLRDPRFFDSTMQQNRDLLRRLIEERDGRVMWESVNRMGAQLSVPPIVDALARATGGVQLNQVFKLGGGRAGEVGQPNAPGYEEGRVVGDPWNPTVRSVLEALTGAVGITLGATAQNMEVARQVGVSSEGQRQAAGEVIRQNLLDRTPYAAPMWSGPRRVDPFDIAATVVRDAEHKMHDLSAGFGDISRPGTIGAGNRTEVVTEGVGRQRPPADIIPIIEQFKWLYAQQAGLRGDRAVAQQRITALRSDGTRLMNLDQLRAAENVQNQRVRQINEQIMNGIVNRESALSRQYGYRIRLDRLNPQRGLDQFDRL